MYKKPSRREIKDYYSKYYPKMLEIWEKSGVDPRPLLLRKLRIDRMSKKKILDIGCGTGKLIKSLKLTKRNEVHGIDISREFLKTSKKRGITTLYYDIDKRGNLPYPMNFFDMILMMDLIEHVFYIKSLFKKSYKVLKPKGRIIATMPNWMIADKKDTIQKVYEKSLQKVYKRKVPEKAKRYADFNHITVPELKKILKATGFRIRKMHGFKWRWRELSSKERKYLWSNPLKGRDLLIVIEKN